MRDPNVSLSEQVVVKLCEGLDNSGHIIYCDNFFSSPSLFLNLKEKGIGASGTVKPSRKQMPVQQRVQNLILHKGDLPHFMIKVSDPLMSCAWHDTKRVNLLSTVENNLTVDKEIRSKEADGGVRKVEKPVVAEKCNTYMSGVDLMDQKLGTYANQHKVQKWYQVIFQRFLQTALLNGYVVFQDANPDSKMTVIQFREKVIDGLLSNWAVRCGSTPGRTSGGPELARLTQRHFLGQYDDKKHRPQCVVCSVPPNVRHQTRFYCKQCMHAMCPVPCFEKYHSVRHFRA